MCIQKSHKAAKVKAVDCSKQQYLYNKHQIASISIAYSNCSSEIKTIRIPESRFLTRDLDPKICHDTTNSQNMCPLSPRSRKVPRLRLAQVLEARGAFAEAEPLRRRELEARERLRGPEHRWTLIAVNNLAFVLKRLGKFSEAPLMCCAAVTVADGWCCILCWESWGKWQENNNQIFRSSQNFVIYVEVR